MHTRLHVLFIELIGVAIERGAKRRGVPRHHQDQERKVGTRRDLWGPTPDGILFPFASPLLRRQPVSSLFLPPSSRPISNASVITSPQSISRG